MPPCAAADTENSETAASAYAPRTSEREMVIVERKERMNGNRATLP
jgi:hypothetical protein